MINNASGVTCQLCNFCFECMTLYRHFSAFNILKLLLAMGMGICWNGDIDDGEMGMGMRYWTENGNGIGVGLIPREWEGMGTAIVISAHL